MKLYLFGGSEMGQAPAELKLIEDVIKSVGATQVLHIPFARIQPSSAPEWNEDYVHRYMDLEGIEYLNAENQADIVRANDPLVFISGGSKGNNLMDELASRPELVRIIRNAEHVIGESKGSMVLGTHFRDGKDLATPLRQGLAIIPNTVIEPHYFQWGGQDRLAATMNETSARYGIGIDSMTAIIFDLTEFPSKWEKIGEGNVEVKERT